MVHENLDVQKHLKLAVEKICVLEKELVQANEKNNNLEKDVTVQKILLQMHMKESMKKHNLMHSRLDQLGKELKEAIKLSTDKLNVQGTHSQGNVGKHEKEFHKIQNDHDHQGTSRMFISSDHQGTSRMFASNDHQGISRMFTSSENQGTSWMFTSNDTEPFSAGTGILNEVEKSSHGVFLWKINNYEEERRLAEQSDKCIYSQPFFTSEFGYKLRLEGWLNGNNIGRGSCLSLYMQIMPGPHDHRLKWPFPYRYTLSILNQRNESMHRERDPSQVEGEMRHLYFDRPIYAENKGCGSASLITHRNIVNSGFLVDDAIYLKCKIYI